MWFCHCRPGSKWEGSASLGDTCRLGSWLPRSPPVSHMGPHGFQGTADRWHHITRWSSGHRWGQLVEKTPEEAVAAATPLGRWSCAWNEQWPVLRNLWVSLLRMICLILQISFFQGHCISVLREEETKAKAAGSLANLGREVKTDAPMFPAREAGSDDDLFQSAKPKPAKKTNPFPLLEDEDDLFTDQRGTKNGSKSNSQQDIILKSTRYIWGNWT